MSTKVAQPAKPFGTSTQCRGCPPSKEPRARKWILITRKVHCGWKRIVSLGNKRLVSNGKSNQRSSLYCSHVESLSSLTPGSRSLRFYSIVLGKILVMNKNYNYVPHRRKEEEKKLINHGRERERQWGLSLSVSPLTSTPSTTSSYHHRWYWKKSELNPPIPPSSFLTLIHF